MGLFRKTKAQRVVRLVRTMRKNAENMRMWKNIPLAQESVELLRAIDDPKETPMAKAMACRAIVDLLPEYDVPRLVLGILRYQLELVQLSEEHDAERYPTEEEVKADIQRLEDYLDVEHVSSSEFQQRYQRHLKADPIERTPEWEAIYYKVEQECDRRLKGTPRGMGFCFPYWSTRREVLAEHGIAWRSPHEMNPHVLFD